MNALVGLSRAITHLPKAKCLSVAVMRQAGHWNKDYMPERLPPKTKEELEVVANKYGIHPDEYIPHPRSAVQESGTGDYPDMPLVGTDVNDPYYPYDHPMYKRNYNELVNYHWEILGEDRCCYLGTEEVTPFEAFGKFFLVMGFFAFFFFYCELNNIKFINPRLEKHMPEKGKVHYKI